MRWHLTTLLDKNVAVVLAFILHRWVSEFWHMINEKRGYYLNRKIWSYEILWKI